ncbi:response regulator [Aliterella atlantica]|uniref:Response regulator receiver protein n=1 Tax=Aliterella atlantica CENA595 TaxID=1618023 RepID=A0A0D8ZQN0_9CYAN|nr:response regulator [Aliterella atlantica]KJH70779.1 response regulator receiver protein [Aliterella atlantica CENA595]
MKKILVIEDEPPVRANILELLEAEEFEAVGAENGFIGAIWAQEHLPDLIICDVMMPEVDGYEVLSALRQVPTTATIPFIFLTAMADKADIRQGMDLGADDYLTKPFTRAELLGAIYSRFSKQAVILQQFKTERDRVETLQQKVQELQQSVNSQGEVLQQLQQEVRDAMPKLNMAIGLLKGIGPGMQRERCVEILQQSCQVEIALLNQMPYLRSFLEPENLLLLQQLNVIKDNSPSPAGADN